MAERFPLFTLLIAFFAGVTVPVLIRFLEAKQERRIKEYEVTFLEKRRSYSALLTALYQKQREVASTPLPRKPKPGQPLTVDQMYWIDDEITALSFQVDPFLVEKDRKWLDDELLAFENERILLSASTDEPKKWEHLRTLGKIIQGMRSHLTVRLFGDVPKQSGRGETPKSSLPPRGPAPG